MSATETVAAAMLVCSGNPTLAAQADEGDVAVMKVPVTATMQEALKEEPPLSRLKYADEEAQRREWTIGGGRDPNTGEMTLLRLRRSENPIIPFTFVSGKAKQEDDGLVRFTPLAEGNCDLQMNREDETGGAK